MWASASAVIERDDVSDSGEDEEWFVSGTVNYCTGSTHGSDMAVVDFMPDGTTRSDWGNGNGAALFNTQIPSCIMGENLDSNFAMVADEPYLTLVGTGSDDVLTERISFYDGQRDTAAYGPDDGNGNHPGFAYGPFGIGYAATLDTRTVDHKVVVAGRGSGMDYLVMRLNGDGSLDTTFGQNGSILIDFGTTGAVRTDGGKSVVLRTLDGGNSFDILVVGYTFDSAAGKYKISLADLLADNFFRVT